VRQLLPVPDPEVGATATGEPLDDAALGALLEARYLAVERPAPADRPWVLVNMVASVDGATALDGRSGGLGGPTDQRVLGLVRSVADVVVAGAATVRAEGYGPPRTSVERRAQREARGQAPLPRIAVVTGSLDLDLGTALFTTDDPRPLVITTTDAPADRLAATAVRADVVEAGTGRVDLPAALGMLHATGCRTVLVEGGPSINGQFVAAGLVDELCLTVSPRLVGGGSSRIAHGPAGPAEDLVLAHALLDDDGLLFLRYLRR
jgi:riboflavin-specific deaminase-like protein